MNITGKRVLITGGSSGIGLALARILLAKGAKVAISGRCPEVVAKVVGSLQSVSAEVHGIVSDAVTIRGRDARLEQALATLGGLDVLVHSAGGMPGGGRLENMDDAELQAMTDVTAPLLLTRTALPLLRDSGDAMVVDVFSGIARIGAPFYATYAAAKIRLGHFGEALRRDLKRKGIHVLTVYPEGMEMPMLNSNLAGPKLGFVRESTSAIAEAISRGIETRAFQVILAARPGSDDRAKSRQPQLRSTSVLRQFKQGVRL
ncbi:SDR family NAD(P)-dependent oxidoreductase [Rhizobium jaguaris]|uniref:SDR family oxidoreductase n=1 Tax=Rhizobium jaguaris TaxID=1312183 RepID=A0A387G1Q0_9HYPH|nr:SDR family oxidoreductase [Rhizobium jaguaris]AYG62274.1 SDR family oxidoreductase [Rhizobium jaguaris]